MTLAEELRTWRLALGWNREQAASFLSPSYRTTCNRAGKAAAMTRWKEETRAAQLGLCLICGQPVDGLHGSWDHLVPIATAPRAFHAIRVGLAYWTHPKCNSQRGHSPPTQQMLARASDAISRLPEDLREQARRNLTAAAAIHQAFVAALEQLSCP